MDTDPRPRVVVAVFGAVVRVTERIWSVGGDASLAALREATAAHLDQVEPALTGDWRRVLLVCPPVTSFDTSPQLNVWRMLLALAVVFVMLATTGWTALRGQRERSPLEASAAAWERGRIRARPARPRLRPRPARPLLRLLDRGPADPPRPPLPAHGRQSERRPGRPALPGQPGRARTARAEERRRTHDSRLSPAGQHEAERRMRRYTSLLAHHRRVLAFDPAGSGRVAEVFGDLGRAERISVVVPGSDTDLLTFQRTERVYSAPVGMARALYRASGRRAPRRVPP
ncbi:hypothetical protein SFUMM280S_01998 [Streptomyces fumanus]